MTKILSWRFLPSHWPHKAQSDGLWIDDTVQLYINPAELASLPNVPAGDVPEQASLPMKLATSAGNLASAATVNSASTIPGIDQHWDGITFAQGGGWYPPDNGLAAGASAVITAENSAIQLTSLTGGSAVTLSLSSFFSSVVSSGYFLSDPRVLYDAQAGHFVITEDEISNNLSSSKILLAVSKTGNPTLNSSDWIFDATSTTYVINGQNSWADQPLASTDGKNIYITTNQFSSSGNYVGDALTVFGNVLSSGTFSTVTATGYASPSYQPAAIKGGGAYFISHYSANSLSIMQASSAGTVISTTNISLGSIDYGNGSYSVAQTGVANKIDAGDGRVNSAAYDPVNRKLYVVFEVQPISGTGQLPSVELIQMDVSQATPKILAIGNLNTLLPKAGVAAGAATLNASVAVDGAGDVIVNFNVSGPSMSPADYYALWLGAGSSNSTTIGVTGFSTAVDYHDSVQSYVDPNNDSIGRWGDYSTAVADSNSSTAFYISNEFVNGTASGYVSWGTAVAHVVASLPTPATYTVSGFLALNPSSSTPLFPPVAIADTSTHVGSSLDTLETYYQSVASISLTDTPAPVSIAASQSVSDHNVLLKIIGSYNLTVTGTTNNDTLEDTPNSVSTLSGLGGTDTFMVLGTATITDLGGADILQVSAGGIANATIATAWTATSATSDAGTVNITTNGLSVNLSAASGSVGYTVTDIGTNATLIGSNFADAFHAGNGDTLTGGLGIDTFAIGSGTATITDLGAGGADILQVSAGGIANATVATAWTATSATSNAGTVNITTNGLSVDLSAVTIGGHGFTVTNTGAAATLVGSNLNDTLVSGTGNDTLNGGAGNDIINGGKGADTLTGGPGSDTFVFAKGDSGQSTGFDIITDYTKGAVGIGDLINYTSGPMVIGGNANPATGGGFFSTAQASINQTTGVATFATSNFTNNLANDLAAVAARISAAGDAAGKFALFHVTNDAGNEYLFISDGSKGVTSNDEVVHLVGVNSVGSIDLTHGHLTILT